MPRGRKEAADVMCQVEYEGVSTVRRWANTAVVKMRCLLRSLPTLVTLASLTAVMERGEVDVR